MLLKTFTDQMGREVTFAFPPQRIVSLVPSQTELLHDLGLGERVVGITKFCVHPDEWYRLKTRVGGTKQHRMDVIDSLKPDLVIGNKEENHQDQIERLAERYPVWMSDITNLDEALEMIHAVGELTGKQTEAKELTLKIRDQFQNLVPAQTIRTAYFIWRDPYMVAGADTFINDMLERCGFVNVFQGEAGRYPQISVAKLQEADPELALLSSEPYPFKQQHIKEVQSLLPEATIRMVDGELFSWYGSRMLRSASYFNQLISELSH